MGTADNIPIERYILLRVYLTNKELQKIAPSGLIGVGIHANKGSVYSSGEIIQVSDSTAVATTEE